MDNKRLLSIDALRGFDMFFIMGFASLVVTVCRLFPGGGESWLATQMTHPDWNGLTHHDIIFPLFLFISGMTFPFSLEKSREKGMGTGAIARKVLFRGLTLIAFGMVCNGFFTLKFDTLRFYSVLGRIGLAWMMAAFLFMGCGKKARIGIAAALLIGYNLLLLIPAPDYPGASSLSMEGNIVGYIDRCLLPGHLLYKVGFDPEGLLSTLPAIVTAMLGQFTGEFVRDPKIQRKTLWMLVGAAVLVVAGLIWSTWLPLNKKLWTSSFTLVVGGISLAHFALFYWLIDVKGWKKWAFIFQVIGVNSITIYMLQRIVSFAQVNRFFLGGLAGLFPDPVGNVILATGYLTLSWLVLLFFYRNRIFLKV